MYLLKPNIYDLNVTFPQISSEAEFDLVNSPRMNISKDSKLRCLYFHTKNVIMTHNPHRLFSDSTTITLKEITRNPLNANDSRCTVNS